MIVVADSSPLNYLVLLGHAELLHRFYDQVVVPEAVAAELSSQAAPVVVREWIKSAPAWLSIVPVDAAHILQVTDELDAGAASVAAVIITRTNSRRRRSNSARGSKRWNSSSTVCRRCERALTGGHF